MEPEKKIEKEGSRNGEYYLHNEKQTISAMTDIGKSHYGFGFTPTTKQFTAVVRKTRNDVAQERDVNREETNQGNLSVQGFQSNIFNCDANTIQGHCCCVPVNDENKIIVETSKENNKFAIETAYEKESNVVKLYIENSDTNDNMAGKCATENISDNCVNENDRYSIKDDGKIAIGIDLNGTKIETAPEVTSPLEIDIYAMHVQAVVLQRQPSLAPYYYVDMSPGKLPTEQKHTCLCMIPLGIKNPDKKSDIKIEGDEFGAALCTFKERRKEGGDYYRHFLVDLDPHGPAEEFRLETSDELVLLNEEFAPDLTHQEVLGLFHDVKLDGRTRLVLVIRRVQNQNNKKKWVWIETSAVLCPDRDIEEQPQVKDLEYKSLSKEEIEVPKSKHLYKAPGTQKFLNICDGRVCIDILKGDNSDRTKIIWKRAKYWEDKDDPDQIDFAAALCDVTETWYIGVDNKNKIVLTNKPVWFRMIKLGSKVRFQFKEIYLGYDRESGEVEAEVKQCVFEELPGPNDGVCNDTNYSNECVDESKEHADDESSDTSSRSSRTASPNGHSQRRSRISSYISVYSDKENITSSTSQSSVDSDRTNITSTSSQLSLDTGRLSSSSERKSISSPQDSIDFRDHNYILPRVMTGASTLTPLQSSTSGYRSDYQVDESELSQSRELSLTFSQTDI